MAKKTILAIVQDILSDMNSDEVNSIDDTLEATQVANIVKTTYEELINDRDWPHLKVLVALTPSGTSSRPTHMTVSENVQRVLWIKYNKRITTDTKDKFSEVTWKEPKDFLNIVNARDTSATDVTSITDPSGIILSILNDTAPMYYTSFDDDVLVFDAYDSVVDTTLQASKTQAYIYKETDLSLTDTSIPDLPAKAFPYLISEAKSVAFNAIKQAANQKEEQRSRRQRTWLARDKWRINGGIKFPTNFGRQK